MPQVEESMCNEEWYQPELECRECGCTFMYSSYPDLPKYPHYCPNCGIKFESIKRGDTRLYNFNN